MAMLRWSTLLRKVNSDTFCSFQGYQGTSAVLTAATKACTLHRQSKKHRVLAQTAYYNCSDQICNIFSPDLVNDLNCSVAHLNPDTLVDSASKAHKDFMFPGLTKDSLLPPEDVVNRHSASSGESVFFSCLKIGNQYGFLINVKAGQPIIFHYDYQAPVCTSVCTFKCLRKSVSHCGFYRLSWFCSEAGFCLPEWLVPYSSLRQKAEWKG